MPGIAIEQENLLLRDPQTRRRFLQTVFYLGHDGTDVAKADLTIVARAHFVDRLAGNHDEFGSIASSDQYVGDEVKGP